MVGAIVSFYTALHLDTGTLQYHHNQVLKFCVPNALVKLHISDASRNPDVRLTVCSQL